MTDAQTTTGEARTMPLAEIHVEDQFNPRSNVERSGIERLAESIRQHGVLQPLVVANGGDGYRLIAGGRRYRAAQEAGLVEVPVIVLEPDADTAGLDLALVENIAREQLDPVEEARAFRRLIDEAGLTRKGVAERLSIPQKRVTERLQILDLPDALHPRVACGDIPPGAIKALTRLAKIHSELPSVAVAHVEHEVEGSGWEQPTTWSDIVEDPIGVVASGHDDERALPVEVYEAGRSYSVARFALTEKAAKDLVKFAELTGTEAAGFQLRFEREEVEQAEALGACHRSGSGFSALIVGQEIADQLACDCIARRLKAERQRQRETESWDRDRGTSGDEALASPDVTDEDAEKERRRTEREAAQEARRSATAYNHELGIACAKRLSRLKVDDKVVKLLACVDLHGELGKIAMRGARYGFPGWTQETELKNGRRKTEYYELGDATEAARSYLANAKTAADVAGRAVALIAMARYADENAVAKSQASFYSIDVYGPGLPWSHEIVDLIDDICAERLPDHLTRAQRDERAEQRKTEAERERAQAVRKQLIDEALAEVEQLDPEARARLLAEVEGRLGDFSYEAWPLRHRIAELAAASTPDENDAGEDEETAEAA